jgi:Transcriptional regulator, AbiEi antitoxin, Type IV TA system/Transcriptional regulator, AbiEi antitoxin N-terminal domain
MNTKIEPKLQKLWQILTPKTVCTASWLVDQGFSHSLQKRYRRSGWLESIGQGAYRKPSDQINWKGGLFAVQNQLRLPIHVGALTALTLQGYTHYLRLEGEAIYLFAPLNTKLPRWFKLYKWGDPVEYYQTSSLPKDLGLTEYSIDGFTIQIALPERALMECLYLASQKIDLTECYDILEGLTTLRPQLLQKLLEVCTSIKVKRLFLYLADKANHSWYSRLDINSLDLGKGVRTITKEGVYVEKFKLILSQELVNR